jgi:C1A family cysteine protease
MLNRRSIKAERLLMFFVIIFSALFVFSSFAYSYENELNEIIQAIESGGKKWNAGETSISKLLPEERIRRLGTLIPPPLTQEELLSVNQQLLSEPKVGAPVTLDWRNYVTPVRDQGQCGSCWAFATAAALESQVLLSQNTPGTDLNLSEQVLVSCGGAGDCGGGYISYASDYIRNTGLPLESCYPYTAKNGSCGNACDTWQSNTYQISNWHWVSTSSPTLDGLKNALFQYGPLVTTLRVYSDFFYYRSGVYSHSSGSYQGAHAVLIVGYDDPGQYFIVKNSWGTGWGESGYFKIAYSELNRVTEFGYWTIAYEGTEPPPDLTTITVSTPNGGETYQAGTTQTIRWSYTGNPGSYVKIELLKGGALNSTITSSTSIGSGGSGSYTWTVPSTQTPGTDYKVSITSTSNSTCKDVSDQNFNITASTTAITVSTPNGGETYQAGTTQTIRWSYTGNPGSYVKIELLKGGVRLRLISFMAISRCSYNWKIPSSLKTGTDYRIKITSISNRTYSDISDQDFTISNNSSNAFRFKNVSKGGNFDVMVSNHL